MNLYSSAGLRFCVIGGILSFITLIFLVKNLLAKKEQPPKKKILIVSADRNITTTITNKLNLLGCEVTMASDFEMARSIIGIHYFDLLITDLFVPYVTASPVMKNIADILPNEAPTIFMLKRDESPQGLGANDKYIVKPLDLTKLLEMIHELL